ncbi:MAG: peptidylprolyl isomerase [Planctomycetaceae bacterium]|jgi:cyclophilin family peptidyl-prolyl cis-trans isomerase|nr:peptidylprolyl isomerase [Planctomycetaceae bacterium]
MTETTCSHAFRPKLTQLFHHVFGVKGSPAGKKRNYLFEPLEERIVLDAGPVILNMPEEVNIIAGSTYHIPLDGLGLNPGDQLTYTVRSTGESLSQNSILSGNKSIRIHLVEYNDDGTVSRDFGDIIFQLFESEAPITTARIKDLVESGFYNGLTFHRIIDDFMMQGGDPLGTGAGGSGVNIIDEFSTLLSHNSSGYVSMANANDPNNNVWNTGDSQFFLTDRAIIRLDNIHTIFGFITQGNDVRDAVNSVETDANDKPLKTIKIESMEVIDDTENGVLRITTDASKTGTEILTVTVTDAAGNETEYEVRVNIHPAPIVTAFDPVEMQAGTSMTITLPDLKGFAEYTVYRYSGSHPGMTFEVVDGNQLIITARDDVSGLQYGTVVADEGVSFGQYLPIFVTPAAPHAVLTGGDTGTVGDGITAADNSGDDSKFQFTLDNIIPQATLKLYQNGVEVPFTIVSSEVIDAETGLLRVVIETVPGADNKLNDGTYVFQLTQTQTFPSSIDHAPLVSEKSAAITLKVVSKPPTITNPVNGFEFDALMGEELLIPLTTNQDLNGDITFAITSGNPPAGMEVVERNGEKFLVWTPQPGQEGGDYPVTLTASNGSGLSSSVEIMVLLQGGPLFDITGETVQDEGGTLELDLSPSASDETEGPVTYTVLESSLPEGAVYTLESTGEKTARFTWTTTEADGPGTYSVIFLATDSEGVSRRKMVSVTVNEVNTPPYFTPVEETFQAEEHEEFEYTVTAHDEDLPANTLTYEIIDGMQEGMAINTATGRFTWTPGETHGGNTYTVTVKVTDSAGDSDEMTFEIAVAETDDPPVFNPIDDQRLYDDAGAHSVRTGAYDPDIPPNAIRYSLVGDVPEGMTIDPETGVIEWVVPDGYLDPSELSRVVNVTVKATEIIPSAPVTDEEESDDPDSEEESTGTSEEESDETDTAYSEGLFTLKTIRFEIINRQLVTALSIAAESGVRRSSAFDEEILSLPKQAGLEMTIRRSSVEPAVLSSPMASGPIATVYRTYDQFSDIAYGFVGFSGGMPSDGSEQTGDSNEQEGRHPAQPSSEAGHSANRPLQLDDLFQIVKEGFENANEPILQHVAETGSRVKQAVFDLYEVSQELELARFVNEESVVADAGSTDIGSTVDRALSDIVPEETQPVPADAVSSPVTRTSKDVFDKAMQQVQQGKTVLR